MSMVDMARSRDSRGELLSYSLGSSSENVNAFQTIYKCVMLGSTALAEDYCLQAFENNGEGGAGAGDAVAYYQVVAQIGEDLVRVDFHVMGEAAFMQSSSVFSECEMAIIVYDPKTPGPELVATVEKYIRRTLFFASPRALIFALGFGEQPESPSSELSALINKYNDISFLTAENSSQSAFSAFQEMVEELVSFDGDGLGEGSDGEEAHGPIGSTTDVLDPAHPNEIISQSSSSRIVSKNVMMWIGFIVAILALLWYTY